MLFFHFLYVVISICKIYLYIIIKWCITSLLSYGSCTVKQIKIRWYYPIKESIRRDMQEGCQVQIESLHFRLISLAWMWLGWSIIAPGKSGLVEEPVIYIFRKTVNSGKIKCNRERQNKTYGNWGNHMKSLWLFLQTSHTLGCKSMMSASSWKKKKNSHVLFM